MKFWDTIAKMCGVEYRVTQAHKVGEEVGGGYVCRVDIPWTARLKVGRMVAEITATDTASTATVNGYGICLRDALDRSINVAPSGAFTRIGLIAVERIRPMVGKSGARFGKAIGDYAVSEQPVMNANGDVVGWSSKAIPRSESPDMRPAVNGRAAAPTVLS